MVAGGIELLVIGATLAGLAFLVLVAYGGFKAIQFGIGQLRGLKQNHAE